MKRVVLIGSESTGKTTLARRLAEHYDVEWVPEFVRDYAERKRAPLVFDDHAPIAHGQLALEDEYRVRSAERSTPLLIQDTDLLSTAVYCAHYYARCPIWLSDVLISIFCSTSISRGRPIHNAIAATCARRCSHSFVKPSNSRVCRSSSSAARLSPASPLHARRLMIC